MRFIHITDTHIGTTPDFLLYDYPTLPTLEKLVDELNNLAFRPDFILHTGDVCNWPDPEAYKLAKGPLSRLKYPIYYVVGNHDGAEPLREILLGQPPSGDRFDYVVDVAGIRLVVFDTRGPIDPGGTLTNEQLDKLRKICTVEGPPLVIAIHHQPVTLDTPWLDNGGKSWDPIKHMKLDRPDEFLAAISPARDRICGVFFGHIHASFQVHRAGILFASAASVCSQIFCRPSDIDPTPADHVLPGYNIVTIEAGQTVIQQCTFTRP